VFAWWGRTVYRYRYIVIGVMVALCLGGGVYGISLGQHVTQSGFYDEGSQSVHASVVSDKAYGRDTSGHIIGIYTAPEGKTVDDPAFQKKILDNLAQVEKDHPDQILRSIGYFKSPDVLKNMADADKQHAFMSIQLKGDNDDTILTNYNKNLGEDGKTVKEALNIPGVEVQQAGLQPLAGELTGTIGEDQQRGELLGVPLVMVVLFFVFGGVIAASLPMIVGGLTIAGSLGIIRLLAEFIPVHFFAQPVVTLVGLGIAIDFGLYIVSRFREEIAEGYDTEAALRRTMMTSGRTVTFSAVIIVASAVPLLLFPQTFLKSITYAIIATVVLSALLSVTVLAGALAIVGPNIDALGVRTLLRIPFLRNWTFSRRIIDWRSPGAGGVRQDLPRFPHRAADPGDGERQRSTRHRRADRRGAQQGDADPWLHRRQQRPVEDVAGTLLPRRSVQGPVGAGDPERPGKPQRRREEDRRTARHTGAPRHQPVRRRHARTGAGQYSQPVRQAAADGDAAHRHHHDPDVPGLRLGGAADQGGGHERPHARVHDGRVDVDVRRRARRRVDELHTAAADGADDRHDHRDHLGSVDRLRGLPGLPHGRGP
jgi:uncharacterized membrane protein YdfJ with MMPL/SSD domain